MEARLELNLEPVPADGEQTQEWQIQSLPHSLQEDGHNCGVFVLMVNNVTWYTVLHQCS